MLANIGTGETVPIDDGTRSGPDVGPRSGEVSVRDWVIYRPLVITAECFDRLNKMNIQIAK